MEVDALKIDLLDKIEHADTGQLKELYGLVINYFNSTQSDEEGDSLSDSQKKILYKSLEQADAGLGTPLRKVNERLRAKYGLNG
jgi:hypothetical protein